jgi:hypothetical protein
MRMGRHHGMAAADADQLAASPLRLLTDGYRFAPPIPRFRRAHRAPRRQRRWRGRRLLVFRGMRLVGVRRSPMMKRIAPAIASGGLRRANPPYAC